MNTWFTRLEFTVIIDKSRSYRGSDGGGPHHHQSHVLVNTFCLHVLEDNHPVHIYDPEDKVFYVVCNNHAKVHFTADHPRRIGQCVYALAQNDKGAIEMRSNHAEAQRNIISNTPPHMRGYTPEWVTTSVKSENYYKHYCTILNEKELKELMDKDAAKKVLVGDVKELDTTYVPCRHDLTESELVYMFAYLPGSPYRKLVTKVSTDFQHGKRLMDPSNHVYKSQGEDVVAHCHLAEDEGGCVVTVPSSEVPTKLPNIQDFRKSSDYHPCV